MFPLRVRSCFSLLHGTTSPAHLCKRAKELGYSGLALTDRDNLYGLHPFLSACKQYELRPIIGAEISCPDNSMPPLGCLVQSQQGYSNLCRLISLRHRDNNFALANIPAELSKGIFFLCQDLNLLALLHKKNFKIAADLGNSPTSKARAIYHWAKQQHIITVCTPDSNLGNKDDQQLFTLLQAIKSNTSLSKISEKQGAALEEKRHYINRFSMWPETIASTDKVAHSCNFTSPDFSIVMPPWTAGKQGECATNVLREQSYRGARKRYGDDLSEMVVERLEHELSVIDSMGFSSYFLIVRDIVHPKNDHGIRTKRRICGRGSGAASLVAYCLQITNVCPVKHNLYFERFLNPGRTDPPDIDIDFSWDERDEVLEQVFTDHKDHVAMVANHVCFKPRMAIRETAKAFGLPGYEISRLTKRLPWLYHSEEGLKEQVSTLPALRDQNLDEPWPEILHLAAKLIGLPRYLSVHPGGVVITPKRIDHYVPIEQAKKGLPIIQWEKDGAEEAGLVKIDILGNRSLGVIRDCIKNVRSNEINFHEQGWEPEDDEQTKNNVAKGSTMGCFYIESPAMRLLQKKANTGDFEQLVLQSSIIRPAANEFVREYVRRLQGGEWHPLHPLLQDVLDDTFGLMVYQEDVSKVAVTLAGFSHARADGLRKIISKKDRERRLKDYKDEFYLGCGKKNISLDTIHALWEMMMSFDGYSFCKPHSASYAKVSFQAAYLKTHFPAEFIAAVISNGGGFYSTFGYVSEAKRMGVKVLQPDVNTSNTKWFGKDMRCRVGLQSVHTLSRESCEKIITLRKQKVFLGMADFLHRVRPAEDEARSLIHAGALDSLEEGKNRPQLLWDLACYRRLVTDRQRNTLFAPVLPQAPELKEQASIDKLRFEYLALGFLCNSHPVSQLNVQITNRIKGKDIPRYVNKIVTFIGWLLTGKIVSTKTGEAMEFLTFEDETATVEATFFPNIYRKYAHILSSGKGYILTGLVEEDYGATTLTVKNVVPLQRKVQHDNRQ